MPRICLRLLNGRSAPLNSTIAVALGVLFAVVAPGIRAVAQSATVSGGSMSLDGASLDEVKSTTGTSTAPSGSTVASITSVVLSGVTVPSDPVNASPSICGSCNGLLFTTFILKNNSSGKEFVLLGSPGGGYTDSLSNATITIQDGASAAPYDVAMTSSATYAPSSYWIGNYGSVPTSEWSGSQNVGSPSLPQTDSSSTLNSTGLFKGAQADGTWTLYMLQSTSDQSKVSISGWTVNMTYAASTSDGTSTTVSSSANPANYSNNVTLTATVTDKTHPGTTPTGTVAFSKNGSNLSGCSSVNLSSGTATCTVAGSILGQGVSTITASYGGVSGSFLGSQGSASVLEEVTTTGPTSSGSYVKWCNAVSFTDPGGGVTGQAYPSMIKVSGMPGTVSTLEVEFPKLTGIPVAQHLLVGPGGSNNLDFMDNEFQPTSVSNVDLTLADSGTTPSNSTAATGSWKPWDNNSFNSTFASSTSPTYDTSIPQVPSTINYPQPHSTHTLNGSFSGLNPNGDWALYVEDQPSYTETFGSGWCLYLSETQPTVTAVAAHTGSFSQGQSNAPITVNITNNGTGSTGDPLGSSPLKVTDTLGTGLTYSTFSGTGWSCSAVGQAVTCTNDSSIAQSSSYPTLTVDVNVASNAPGSIANQVSVSGAGITSTTSNTDTIGIVATTTTTGSSKTANYSASSQAISLTATVKSGTTAVNEGTVTFGVFQGSTLIGTGVNTSTVSGGVFTASYTLPAGTAAGSYSIHASFNGDTNYSSSSDNTATLTISAVTPTITWSPVGTIIVGDAGANVLNASVNCTSCGTISYTATPSGGSASSITSTTGLAAGSYTIAANFTASSGNYNSASASKSMTVSGQSVWVVNSGGGTAELAGNGAAITSSADSGVNAAVAIDATGNVWTVGSGTGGILLESVSQTNIVQHSISSGGGLSSPSAVAIDGNSQVWVTNSGNNSISLFLNNGTASSPSTGFTDGSLSNPSGVAVDLAGSVWITNQGNNSLTRVLGAAAPVAPLSTAAANKTTGEKP